MQYQNKKSGFFALGSTMSDFAHQSGLGDVYTKHQVLRLWQKAAEAFVRDAGTQTRAIEFQGGTVTVACLSEPVAKEVGYLAERIVHALNQLLAVPVVKAIEIQS